MLQRQAFEHRHLERVSCDSRRVIRSYGRAAVEAAPITAPTRLLRWVFDRVGGDTVNWLLIITNGYAKPYGCGAGAVIYSARVMSMQSN
ncbi:hypothetical protein C446_17916 [Halobiforma nitratireducens JCM 10879]|uniref:Uncharacterized protein n=1 Tax=Halobiforma nitratireducens JCM 10879 TaxID=1227454 RepID=M0L5P2_9EURY|nr:hypothetical protein C446_17916 [Halobiforma nitratireducens JCM 10879]